MKKSLDSKVKKWSWNEVRIFWQNLTVWAKTFFPMLLEIFLCTLRTCSRYLKGAPNLVICVSKKIRVISQKHRTEIKKVKGREKTLGFFPLPGPHAAIQSKKSKARRTKHGCFLKNLRKIWSSQRDVLIVWRLLVEISWYIGRLLFWKAEEVWLRKFQG